MPANAAGSPPRTRTASITGYTSPGSGGVIDAADALDIERLMVGKSGTTPTISYQRSSTTSRAVGFAAAAHVANALAERIGAAEQACRPTNG